MESKLKVTDVNEEVSFSEILSGDNVINIPLFQRSYRWTDKNFADLWADMQEILDGKVPAQFMGVLVTVPQASQFNKPKLFDIVDGQQRLTSVYLSCLAVAEVLAENGKEFVSTEIAKKVLLNRPFSSSLHNTKIIPAYGDRKQFAAIWQNYSRHISKFDEAQKAANDKAGNKHTPAWEGVGEPMPPPPSGDAEGLMSKQYRRLKKMMSTEYATGGEPHILEILNVLILKLSFVMIALVEPSAAPKIFERLNARGEKITTADLVRNEIFARSSDDPLNAHHIFNSKWEPFVAKFSPTTPLDSYLFPYGLCLNSSVTKSDLFRTLRSRWNQFGTITQVLDDLSRYMKTFFALSVGERFQGDKMLVNALLRLSQMQAPSSIYPFVFKLVEAVDNETQSAESAVEVLELVEDFLFRRSVCGYEPTGLHAVFKGMWAEVAVNGSASVADLRAAIAKRSTVPWPTDTEFADAVKHGDLYRRTVRTYALSEFENSREGETPKETFWIEHVMPQKLTPEWNTQKEVHEKWVNTWANLIPLTGAMNPALGQKIYSQKSSEYSNSIFATPRELAVKFAQWDEGALEERATQIATWAIQRWSNGPP